MKKFDIPSFYKSGIISEIKEIRKIKDPRKQDFSPTLLDFGSLKIYLARHFGFCYGVENAIEIAYKAIDENPGKRIYLLSEMIHNPEVNNDLLLRGVRFIMETSGEFIINWNELTKDDIVIVPAFGTTREIENKLKEIGIDPYRYNTTCPFVEKVWKTSANLGDSHFTVIIHGKFDHEETRATFSHSIQNAKSVIVRNIEETRILVEIISGKRPLDEFYLHFKDKYSKDFNPEYDLRKIGVVNQTTMLAGETEEISVLLRETMSNKYGHENIKDHFADTRETLCYATNDNQKATKALLNIKADFAIVVGGYNSSNTSHIVELLEDKLPTYFINNDENLKSKNVITHYDLSERAEVRSEEYFFNSTENKIIITSGASCPDAIVDRVILKLVSFFPNSNDLSTVLDNI